ncbi:MAG TPA: hypothetical protein VGD98_02340 [Ktedonobacteraceae bacterium]
MIRIEERLSNLKARGLLPRKLDSIGQNYGAAIALVILIIFNLIFTRQFSSVIAMCWRLGAMRRPRA